MRLAVNVYAQDGRLVKFSTGADFVGNSVLEIPRHLKTEIEELRPNEWGRIEVVIQHDAIVARVNKSPMQALVDRYLQAGLIKRHGLAFIRTKAGITGRISLTQVREWNEALRIGRIK